MLIGAGWITFWAPFSHGRLTQLFKCEEYTSLLVDLHRSAHCYYECKVEMGDGTTKRVHQLTKPLESWLALIALLPTSIRDMLDARIATQNDELKKVPARTHDPFPPPPMATPLSESFAAGPWSEPPVHLANPPPRRKGVYVPGASWIPQRLSRGLSMPVGLPARGEPPGGFAPTTWTSQRAGQTPSTTCTSQVAGQARSTTSGCSVLLVECLQCGILRVAVASFMSFHCQCLFAETPFPHWQPEVPITIEFYIFIFLFFYFFIFSFLATSSDSRGHKYTLLM